MLGNQGKACTVTQLLAPVSATDTATGTGSWVDVRHFAGDLCFISSVGVVTAGTATPTIRTASDGAGTGDALLTLNEGAFTAVTTANDPKIERRTVDARATLGYVKIVYTIATGPAMVATVLHAQPTYL